MVSFRMNAVDFQYRTSCNIKPPGIALRYSGQVFNVFAIEQAQKSIFFYQLEDYRAFVFIKANARVCGNGYKRDMLH